MPHGRSLPARALGAVRAAVSWAAGKALSGLTLVPSYLSSVLWLISQAYLDLAKQGYGSNSAVYAVLRTLSMAVAEPPLLAYAQTPAGEPDQPLPHAHPLMQLIRQPNELTTQYGFWEMATLHLGIAGRSHWYKERDRSGQILNLWPLRPDRVGPIYSDSLKPGEHVLQGWSYLVPGTTHYIPLPRTDVLSFILPDPAGESGGIAEGLGPLSVLAAEVGADNEATRFVGAMMANYGAPGVVLTTKTPLQSEDDAKLIKAAFVREFGGQRRGLPAVVDGETTVQPFGFSLRELEFPSLRRVAESRIAAAFGVPAIVAGLQVGLESGIRATIAEQREYMTETTLASYWRRLEDQYTADVAPEYGPAGTLLCRFDLTKVKALQEQLRNEATKVERAFELGTVSVDEYRQAVLNYEPLPNGQGAVRIIQKGIEIDEHGNIAGQQPPPTVDTIAQAAAVAAQAQASGKNGAQKKESAVAGHNGP